MYILNIMKYFLLLFILCFVFQQKSWADNIFNEFLIAKPNMKDIRFKETVIMILYHKQEGALGLVINKPLETISISKLFSINGLVFPQNIKDKEILLYWGGPVKSSKFFIIHSNDYKNKDFIYSNKEFTLSSQRKIILDIANNKGPKKYIVLSGIAVWEPGQLDFEMTKGAWEKKSNIYIPLFDNGQEMWNRVINYKDI